MTSIDDLARRGGHSFERWFDIVRVVMLFIVGMSLIVYAAITQGHDIPFLVTGLVLCGLVPVDQWASRLARRDEEDADE